ncbi:MAG: hypothetical protein ACR2GL_05955 [Thermoleophilaceae bacterium]
MTFVRRVDRGYRWLRCLLYHNGAGLSDGLTDATGRTVQYG